MTQYLEDPTKSVAGSPDVQWANDVIFVYSNLTRRLTEEEAGSPGRYILHRWASDEVNMDKFLKDMVPKASDMIFKQKKDGSDDEDLRFEKKAIHELKSLIKQAVKAAKE